MPQLWTRTPLPCLRDRRPEAAAGPAAWVAVAVVGLVASLLLLEHRMSQQAERTWRAIFGEVVGPSPGTSGAVCEATMTTRCAERAARRSGQAVAWFRVPDGYRFEQLSAVRAEGTASTELAIFTTSGPPALVLLVSASEPRPGPGPAVERLRIDGERVELTLGEFEGVLGEVTLRWRREGVSHSLGLHTLGPDPLDRDAAVELLRELFRRVRYAEPRG